MNTMPTTAEFVIFPAIDLRRGRCVRLRQGDPAAETVFGADPAALARHWVDLGATWLHVVNLDGALQTDAASPAPADAAALPLNLRRLAEIRAAVAAPIQFGGGLRSLADIELALDLGATRVVLGTAAVQNPVLVADALRRYGAATIVIGIDAREGLVATHGWLQTSNVPVLALAQAMRTAGVTHIIFTDIARDGMLSGAAAEASAALARASGLQVIASGGVRDLDDIRRLLALSGAGVAGVIVGQALYTGRLALPDALHLARGSGFQPDGSLSVC
ncbi:1-(5-phosphoribosyl)-5-[(5-phosphoribosylamino)methylideneamino]imidazole-4-carboxamide isomerase [Candidatus Amarolinea dominans]|uniref:1-(5-phosphoribosyl)-5-[(5- phosphoribosylamino)methylideneamino]imidazole-4- carboxamide isomerase n=1 Tax=Candidatus Amarolinea dominans TaxID=3140696 RepID=UPI0031CCAF68